MRAMVGLQGQHTSDAFQCSNVSSSVGLKSFCPWCFKLDGNMETIATHLREVHYWLAIVCDICKAFANMLAQVMLKHHAGCKVKLDKKKFKEKRSRKTLLKSVEVVPINPFGQEDAWDLPSSSTNECGLF